LLQRVCMPILRACCRVLGAGWQLLSKWRTRSFYNLAQKIKTFFQFG
jgi:hypothetical protein